MADRASIPSNVALRLRQEAGFGCCKCGHAIFEYHHIISWEEEEHYRPEDMMILCPTHHSEMKVTPRSVQYDVKRNPVNLRDGFPNGRFIYYHDNLEFMIGSLHTVNVRNILVIDGEVLLGTRRGEGGQVLVSAVIYSKDGDLLLKIIDNEWIDENRANWDIEFRYQYIKVRERAGSILLEIDLKNMPATIKGVIWKNKNNFLISPSKILINGSAMRGSMTNCKIVGAHNGLVLSSNLVGAQSNRLIIGEN